MSNPVLIIYLTTTSVAQIIAMSNGATAVGYELDGRGVGCVEGSGGISGHIRTFCCGAEKSPEDPKVRGAGVL
jgi:hypothetical protein